MIRKLVLSIAIGLVGAVLVHIAVIVTIPSVAQHNAWGRFANLGRLDQIVRVEPLRSRSPDGLAAPVGSNREDFAFIDPAFVTASCRFSVARGPVHMYATTLQPTFWTASIYDRNGDNLYSINDRAAVGGVFDLLVGTDDQLVDSQANLVGNEEQTTIPVALALTEGYLTIRVLVDEESKRPDVEDFVKSLHCQPAPAMTAIRDGSPSARG